MRIDPKVKLQLIIASFFLLPNFIGFLLFTLFPIAASLVLSFFQCDLLQTKDIFSWKFVGLENFTKLLGFYRDSGILKANDPEFWRYLWNTIYLLLKIPLVISASLILALLINRNIKGRVFFSTSFFLPTICTGTALYMLLRWIFNADFGLLNLFINKFSLGKFEGFKWLVDPNLSKLSFIFMNTWIEMGGLGMLLYLAALQNIPQEYYEAASLDGADTWEQFWNVTFPMLGPTTFFVLIMNLINGFQEGFQQAHVITQGGPAGSTTMLSYYIYNQAYVWNHMGYASAISWALFVIVIVITAVSWKFGSKKVFYG